MKGRGADDNPDARFNHWRRDQELEQILDLAAQSGAGFAQYVLSAVTVPDGVTNPLRPLGYAAVQPAVKHLFDFPR